MKGGIKMSDIIKAIYRGEYNPMENLGDELELLKLDVLKKSEELNKTLNDEQKEKLEEFCEASSKVNSAMETEAFKRGFKLGAAMMKEINWKDDTTTEKGKYSAKYALTEKVFCAECGTPYRRVTWTAKGFKEIKWRCINRLENGKTFCHNSPTIAEDKLHDAIVTSLNTFCNE